MVTRRIANEPAYVLHRYDWSESSLILEVFTRHHGRVALMARGAKKPSSGFRPILLPMQLLHLAFGGEAEIRTLKSAEWQGGHVMPTGDALLSGYYVNELLLRLLARDDPHPALFDAYALTMQMLASPHTDTLPLALRTFELSLLGAIGLLPDLSAQTATLAPLASDVQYTLLPDAGLREANAQDRSSIAGAQWSAIEHALKGQAPFTATMQACLDCLPPLKTQLRALLHYHCDARVLKTRQLMIDLQSL